MKTPLWLGYQASAPLPTPLRSAFLYDAAEQIVALEAARNDAHVSKKPKRDETMQVTDGTATILMDEES
jgi:hypothetical protein